MMRVGAAIAACVALAGCASTVEMSQFPSETNHVVDQNFTLGAEKTTYVGDAMVRVKDYWVVQAPRWAWKLEQPVVATNLFSTRIPPGIYDVTEQTKVDGKVYDVIFLNSVPYLISQDGHIAKLMNAYGNAASDVRVKPDVTLTKISHTKIYSAPGYKNFELIYTGMTADSIRITYREYSPDDLAKTAFFQELTYNKSEPMIRFRDIQIKVSSVNNQSITFTVMGPAVSR